MENNKNCLCQHECSTRCYALSSGHDFVGLDVKCTCSCHNNEAQAIEKKIMSFVVANAPVTPTLIRKGVAPDKPMPVVQRHIVNLAIRGVIEKRPETTRQRETLWQMATK